MPYYDIITDLFRASARRDLREMYVLVMKLKEALEFDAMYTTNNTDGE